MKYITILSIFLLQLVTVLDAKEASVEQLFNVQTVKVKQLSYAKKIKSFGFVKVDDARVYDVAPRFGGYVEVLYADKKYQKVQKGEVLAKVYAPDVLKAKDDYLNTLNFVKKNPNPAMLESAKIKLKLLGVSDSEIDIIKKEGKTSHISTITSPTNGYIFKKNLNNNSAFNAKSKLFEIVNLDKVWVEVKIHQDQVHLLPEIQEFSLNTPAYSQTFKAKKLQLYPELDEQKESLTLRLEVDNKTNILKPGMYMNVLMSSKNENYLTLPTTAVIRKNGKFFVFIVGEYEGEYEPLEVEVSVLNPDTYTITSGLEVGDEVVNNALFMMDSDAQVNGMY